MRYPPLTALGSRRAQYLAFEYGIVALFGRCNAVEYEALLPLADAPLILGERVAVQAFDEVPIPAMPLPNVRLS